MFKLNIQFILETDFNDLAKLIMGEIIWLGKKQSIKKKAKVIKSLQSKIKAFHLQSQPFHNHHTYIRNHKLVLLLNAYKEF